MSSKSTPIPTFPLSEGREDLVGSHHALSRNASTINTNAGDVCLRLG